MLAIIGPTAGCTRAPERDAQRDKQLQDRFSERKLAGHRFVPPLQASTVDELPSFESAPGAARLPGAPRGPVPEVYWVAELATPDAITAVARHDDLLSAGHRGFDALLAWLDQVVTQTGPPSTIDTSSMLQVLRCAGQMLDVAATLAISTDDSARLAAVLSRIARPSSGVGTVAPGLRSEALRLLARVYTGNEAAVLAEAIGDRDAVTAALAAEALTIHIVGIAVPADESATEFRTDTDWPSIPGSLAARLMTRPAARELRLQGLLDPTAELRARTLSRSPVWHAALDHLAARSRAALRGAAVVWSMLEHPSPGVRSRAAHCLRLMTGEFAGYNPTAGPIQRQLQIARWASLLVRMVPASRSDFRTELPGSLDR
ncbi:MAG: hypothetical protein AB7K09_14515 [Planctomycetota bacterium]